MRSDLAMAALASAAVPGMKPVTVAGVRSDDPEDDVEVQRAVVTDATGRSWMVHAPLNPVAGARMRRHDELVRQLARHVPFKVPAPVGYAALGADGDAAVYPHVEGAPLELGRLPHGPGLASALGRALASVHNIPRGVFEEHDVPTFDAGGCRQRAIADVDRASETGRVPTGLLARWEEAFDAPALWQFGTTPVHGSFSGRTVLVVFGDDEDAGTGRVVAVTDWGEAMVGDPATDLATLYAKASPQAWESVLDSYALARAQRPDPYLHARARLIAETRALRGLAGAVADGREEQVRKIVEALRRMDRLTEDEDSLVPVTARPRTAGGTVPLVGARDEREGDGTGGHGVAHEHEPSVGPAPDTDEVEVEVEQHALDDPREAAARPPAQDLDLTIEVPTPTVGPDDVADGQDEVAGEQDDPARPTATDGDGSAVADALTTDGPAATEDAGPTVDETDASDDDPRTDGGTHPSDDDPRTDGGTHPSDGGPLPADMVELDDDQRLHELYGMPDEEPRRG